MQELKINGLAVYVFEPQSGETVRERVLFTHANGVAALTYADLLQKWANLWNTRIYTYDIRGCGNSKLATAPAYARGRKYIWSHLVKDLENLFAALLQRDDVPPAHWLFAGHSLGAWLSLHAAQPCHVRRLILLDMPLLTFKTSVLWTLACMFQKRDVHSLGQVARRRKQKYKSAELAVKGFQKTPFFKRWPQEKVVAYINANYEEKQDGLVLKHLPGWEADIFEAMPANAASAFLQIPKPIRSQLRIDMLVGSESEVCNPRSGTYFKYFFPKAQWHLLERGGHMFPIENEDQLLEFLKSYHRTDQLGQRSKVG